MGNDYRQEKILQELSYQETNNNNQNNESSFFNSKSKKYKLINPKSILNFVSEAENKILLNSLNRSSNLSLYNLNIISPKESNKCKDFFENKVKYIKKIEDCIDKTKKDYIIDYQNSNINFFQFEDLAKNMINISRRDNIKHNVFYRNSKIRKKNNNSKEKNESNRRSSNNNKVDYFCISNREHKGNNKWSRKGSPQPHKFEDLNLTSFNETIGGVTLPTPRSRDNNIDKITNQIKMIRIKQEDYISPYNQENNSFNLISPKIENQETPCSTQSFLSTNAIGSTISVNSHSNSLNKKIKSPNRQIGTQEPHIGLIPRDRKKISSQKFKNSPLDNKKSPGKRNSNGNFNKINLKGNKENNIDTYEKNGKYNQNDCMTILKPYNIGKNNNNNINEPENNQNSGFNNTNTILYQYSNRSSNYKDNNYYQIENNSSTTENSSKVHRNINSPKISALENLSIDNSKINTSNLEQGRISPKNYYNNLIIHQKKLKEYFNNDKNQKQDNDNNNYNNKYPKQSHIENRNLLGGNEKIMKSAEKKKLKPMIVIKDHGLKNSPKRDRTNKNKDNSAISGEVNMGNYRNNEKIPISKKGSFKIKRNKANMASPKIKKINSFGKYNNINNNQSPLNNKINNEVNNKILKSEEKILNNKIKGIENESYLDINNKTMNYYNKKMKNFDYLNKKGKLNNSNIETNLYRHNELNKIKNINTVKLNQKNQEKYENIEENEEDKIYHVNNKLIFPKKFNNIKQNDTKNESTDVMFKIDLSVDDDKGNDNNKFKCENLSDNSLSEGEIGKINNFKGNINKPKSKIHIINDISNQSKIKPLNYNISITEPSYNKNQKQIRLPIKNNMNHNLNEMNNNFFNIKKNNQIQIIDMEGDEDNKNNYINKINKNQNKNKLIKLAPQDLEIRNKVESPKSISLGDSSKKKIVMEIKEDKENNNNYNNNTNEKLMQLKALREKIHKNLSEKGISEVGRNKNYKNISFEKEKKNNYIQSPNYNKSNSQIEQDEFKSDELQQILETQKALNKKCIEETKFLNEIKIKNILKNEEPSEKEEKNNNNSSIVNNHIDSNNIQNNEIIYDKISNNNSSIENYLYSNNSNENRDSFMLQSNFSFKNRKTASFGKISNNFNKKDIFKENNETPLLKVRLSQNQINDNNSNNKDSISNKNSQNDFTSNINLQINDSNYVDSEC